MKFTAITQTKHEGDNSIMREGYTSQAKKALAYAVRTAEKCGHNYVGTEHLLIGLLNVEDGTAGMVLSECSRRNVRVRIPTGLYSAGTQSA